MSDRNFPLHELCEAAIAVSCAGSPRRLGGGVAYGIHGRVGVGLSLRVPGLGCSPVNVARDCNKPLHAFTATAVLVPTVLWAC